MYRRHVELAPRGGRQPRQQRGAAANPREPGGPELREGWWRCQLMSVDEVPIFGFSARSSSVWLATAHGTLGVRMLAATGELVASMLAGTSPPIDAASYAPARFGL